MSSMGAASYRVETPEEIEARRRRAARERHRRAAVRHAALVAESAAGRSAYGRGVTALRRAPEPSAEASADELEAEAERLEAETAHARPLLDTQLAQVFREELTALAARPAPRAGRTASATAPAPRAEPAEAVRAREQKETAARRRALAERAAGLLARLSPAAPAHLRNQCAADAQEVASAPGEDKARRILASLEDRIRSAERDQRAVQAAAEHAAALAERLRDVPGHRAGQLALRLAEVTEERHKEVPADLVADVERAVAEADTERARRIAARALARVLSDLDYHVGEGFETALVDQGTACAGLPGEPGYGLKVLFDRGGSVLRHIVVRDAEAEGGELADRRAQRAFCAALPALVSGLGRRRVRLGETSLEEPGQRPVPRVAAGQVPRREEGRGRDKEAQA